jgi:hypothetical protein
MRVGVGSVARYAVETRCRQPLETSAELIARFFGWSSARAIYVAHSIIYSGKRIVMAQASVLSDNEIRRVFRIIETTRHSDRNRLAFVLSVFTRA